MAKLLFSICIKSSIAQASLGHARKKEAFREKGYVSTLSMFPAATLLIQPIKEMSAAHCRAND